jgi:hypothetical protein
MPLSNLFHDRTARALASALALIALWAWQGPMTKHNVDSQQLVRRGWKQCADVVVVGDSTVRQNIYTGIVEQALGDTYRVANFGYPAQAIIDDDYLTAAERVLDPSNPDRTMVISVSSWNSSLVATHVYRNEGKQLARATATLGWRDELDLRLASRGLCALLWNACPWRIEHSLGRGGQLVIDEWHDDETDEVPRTLDYFKDKPAAFPPGAIDPLYRRIRELLQRGVHVFAYVERDRPLIAAITEGHGFDPNGVERRLREAGATIVEYPTDMRTRDGTHLTHAEAKRWSAALGAALATALPHRDHVAPQRCAWPE